MGLALLGFLACRLIMVTIDLVMAYSEAILMGGCDGGANWIIGICHSLIDRLSSHVIAVRSPILG